MAAPPPSVKSDTPATLSQESLFESLDRQHPETSERLLAFLASCEDLNVRWEVLKFLVVRMTTDASRITVFVVSPDGQVDMGYAPGMKSVYRAFVERVVAVVPGAILRETEKTVFAKKADGSYLTIWDILEHGDGIRSAFEALRDRLDVIDGEKAL
jgi:hypothetical protein